MPQKQRNSRIYALRKLGIVIVATALIIVATGICLYMLHRTPYLPHPPLKSLAAHDGIELGMLAQPNRLNDTPYAQILTTQFSFITSDGQVHWDKFRPSPSKYDFAPLDSLVALAEKNNMSIQVHHLVWGEKDSLPQWLKNAHYSRQQLLDSMHSHISTVVGHYKRKSCRMDGSQRTVH